MTRVSRAEAGAAGRRRADAHHSDGLGVDHDLRRDCGEVGQVCQDVHHRDDGHGDYDGQRQVPAGGQKVAHDHYLQAWSCTTVTAPHLSGLIISSVT